MLKFLVIILLPIGMFAIPAEAQRKRGHLNPLEVSVYLPGGQTVHVPSTDIKLSGAFGVTTSYKLARFFNFALVYTHYANASAGSYQEEKSKLGVGTFVATPWSKLYSRSRQLSFVHWRGKITGVYDLSGVKMNTNIQDGSLARLKQSYFLLSAEFGIKTGSGMVFIGFSLQHIMNSYSGGPFRTDSNNGFTFNLGISLL
ncbi:MAG: hypothetical protein ACNFW9_05280 [Candidatus Kerfeldbacteria bacterium]